MPPAGQAVGLVQHPGADPRAGPEPAGEKGARSCSGEMRSIPASPSRTRSRASARSGIESSPVTATQTADPVRLQPRHLVRHQCHQRRDHHRQRTRSCGSATAPGSGSRATSPCPWGESRARAVPPIAASTMVRCIGRPSASSGSGRKSSNPNQRLSSLRGSWCSRHQPHAGSVQAVSRQLADQSSRLRELVAHPGRHHRVAPRPPTARPGRRPAPTRSEPPLFVSRA